MASTNKTPSVDKVKASKRSWYQRWCEDWWLTELLALVLSWTSTITLVCLLQKYNGQEASTFGTFLGIQITLATVVAILSTITTVTAQAAIQESVSQLKWLWLAKSNRSLEDLRTFDESSRGPNGSLKLLWKLRMAPMPSLGARLIISSLTIAPLTQQSVVYVQQPIKLLSTAQNNVASISVASRCQEPYSTTQEPDTDIGYWQISSSFKNSVKNGLAMNSSHSINDTLPFCQSGNCSFPVYQSLAICPALANVTANLTDLQPASNKRNSWCIAGQHCLLQDSPNTMVYGRAVPAPTSENSSAGNPSASFFTFQSIAFADHASPLADIYILYENLTRHGEIWESDDNGGVHLVRFERPHYVQAVEFVLDWCVLNLTTEVTNGVATTQRIGETFMAFTREKEAVRRHTGDIPDQGPNDLIGFVNQRWFSVDEISHCSIQKWLSYFFSGYVKPELACYHCFTTSSEDIQSLFDAFGLSGSDGFHNETSAIPTEAEGMRTIQAQLDNVATSLTNYLRGTVPTSDNEWQAALANVYQAKNTIQGQALVFRTVTSVLWGWIAALAAFSVLSVVFFILIIWETHKAGQKECKSPPIWKSDVAPVLQSLHPELHQALGETERSRSIQSLSEVTVRLVRYEDGWKLADADSHEEKTHDESEEEQHGLTAAEQMS